MKYDDEYKRKLLPAEEFVERIESNTAIHVSGAAGIPAATEDALKNLVGKRENIKVTTLMHYGKEPFFHTPEAAGTFQINSIFHDRYLIETDRVGTSAYIPLHFRNAARDLRAGTPDLEWLIVGVSRMDKNGYFTITSGGMVERELLMYAKHIAVEVLDNAPRLFGDTLIHISQVDVIIDEGRGFTPMPVRTPDETDTMIGKQVAELVEDGATVQIGTGGLVDALVTELKNRHDLGIHSEVVTDSTMELLECGAVNNRKKTLHNGLTVTAFWGGSEKFARYLDDNPSFLFRTMSYTNNPEVLSRNEKMTSINAALSVDLCGQCASESIGARQFSGSGGQMDTAVGAQLAPGGKSIIALRSTVTLKDPVTGEKKVQSKIVPTLQPGSVVTLTRTNVHYVATEYGVVCLRGLSVKDRARKLISIAHPDFRDWLKEEFDKQYQMVFK